MRHRTRQFLRNCRRRFTSEGCAVAATEYAILVALIVVVSVGTIRTIGEKFLNLYTTIASAVGDTL